MKLRRAVARRTVQRGPALLVSPAMAKKKTPGLLDLVGMLPTPAGEIVKAARMVGLTQETIKKRAESLETLFGVKLIDSATKALKPGEASRLMMEHASRIFSQARDLTRDLEELAGLQAPELVFGTDMLAAELPLGTALGRMATANSRLRVDASVGDFEDLVKAVIAGRLEFAIADTTSADRHTARLAIEPIAEHRVFFFTRPGHPLTAGDSPSLNTILVFPLAGPRLPQRIAVHFAKPMPHARIDRETGDLSPNLMLNSFSVVKNAVIAGDSVGIAPLAAIAAEIRSNKIALVPFDAPWMHLSYGLFYPRKRSLSRVAQLFVTQLRQVEALIQAREQRALARKTAKPKPRKSAAKKKSHAKANARRRRTATGKKKRRT